tara:strand:+ start:17095 stop:17574 length:480 start_codon:yes stop_codon:yes gene_type:complete
MTLNNYEIKKLEHDIRRSIEVELHNKKVDYSFLDNIIKSDNSIFRKKEDYEHYKENVYFKTFTDQSKKEIKLYMSLKFDKKDEYFIYLTYLYINKESNKVKEEIDKLFERAKEYIKRGLFEEFKKYELMFEENDVNAIANELMRKKLMTFLGLKSNVSF